MQSKAEIRDAMRRLRRTVSYESRAKVGASVCRKLSDLHLSGPVAVYLASGDEIDLDQFIYAEMKRGTLLFAPRWTGQTYELAPVKGLGSVYLRNGPHGIREPICTASPENGDATALYRSIKAWIIPGLAFTRDGGRLGYGGGWYDRMLASADPAARKIGVAYPFQVLTELPNEPHDIRLTDLIV